jgi:5-formyltetrahydrofolate cyclo-ligase
MTDAQAAAQRCKEELRAEARARRGQQHDAGELSCRILGRVAALSQFASAGVVSLYLDFRSEVRTQPFLPALWSAGKRVAVPYCTANGLEHFQLDDIGELAPGALGILEPRMELRSAADRRIAPAELDLIIVPGLAFDPHCNRIGYGKGYYDRLLHQVGLDATVVGVAFQCQIFPEVPMLPYDVPMQMVITETSTYSPSSRNVVAEGGPSGSSAGRLKGR